MKQGLIVISAPQGTGKTTFAEKAFPQDERVWVSSIEDGIKQITKDTRFIIIDGLVTSTDKIEMFLNKQKVWIPGHGEIERPTLVLITNEKIWQ